MATFKKINDSFALVLTNDEASALQLKEGQDLVLRKGSNNAWELVKISLNQDEQTLINKLQNMSFKDRLEGSINSNLNEQELALLTSLVDKDEVVKFKGEGYSKFVFLSPQEKQRFESRDKADSKPSKLSTSDGYWVLNNENAAHQFSSDHYKDLKAGHIIGIKDFSGKYYAITSTLLRKEKERFLNALEKESMTTPQLSEQLKVSQDQVECVVTILKDMGMLFEPLKGVYEAIT